MQVAAARYGLWVATCGAVPVEPIGVEKNQRATVSNAGFVTALPLVDSVFDNPSGFVAAGDDDIKMKVQVQVVAQSLQPLRKDALAVALRSDKDSPASRNWPATRHGSTESGQPAECATAVELAKIGAPAHPLDVSCAVGVSHAFPALLDYEHFLFLQIVEH